MMKTKLEILKSCYMGGASKDEIEYYKQHYMTDEEKQIGKPCFEMNNEEQKVYEILQYNNSQGELVGYNCQKCHNKGYIKYLNKEGYVMTLECSCQKIRNAMQLIEQSGMGNLLRLYTFDRYKTENEWQKFVLNKAQKFVDDDNAIEFVMLGQSGSGKSHICTAICRELILKKSMDVKYMMWVEDSNILKANKMNADIYHRKLQSFENATVLYIDDFLKNEPTQADLSLAMELINNRYNRSRTTSKRMVTIISSERTMDELREFDDALAGRIMEMSQTNNGNYLTTISGEDKNYRFTHIKFVEF